MRGKFLAILVGLTVAASALPAEGLSAPPPPPARAAERAPLALKDDAAGPRATEARRTAKAALADTPGPAVYAYDAAGRLTGVTRPGGEAARYAYDEAGNILNVERYPASRLSVMSMVPASARPGAAVRLQGTGFSATPSADAVAFNGVAATVTAATATTLTVTVPPGVSAGTVTVTVDGVTVPAGTFTPAAPGPVITAIVPASGLPGTEVTVTGSGFAAAAQDDVVSVNGARAEVVSATPASLRFRVPDHASTGKLVIATPAGEVVSAGDFSVPLPDVDPATIESTTRVQVGGPATPIVVATPGKSALVVFDAPASGVADLGLTGNTIGGVRAIAYDHTGREIKNVYTSGSDAVRLGGLLEGRTYQLLIDPSSDSATGQVTVTASELADAGDLSATGAGTAVAVPRAGQRARAVFTGAAGETVSLGLTGNTFESAVYVDVTAPDGAAVLQDVYVLGGYDADLDLPALPATGTYQVLVAPLYAATGAVTVTRSAPVTAGALTSTGPGVTATITRPGQDAVYTFAGKAEGALSIGITANSMAGSTTIDVVAPDGTVLEDDFYVSHGYESEIDIARLPQAGTYRVVVDPAQAGTGSVTLTLSTPVSAGTLTTTGPGVAATITRPGQDAAYTFAGTAGVPLTLGVTGNSLTKAAYVDVVAPGGAVVVDDHYVSAGQSEKIDIAALPATGTYRVVADPVQAGTGAATFTLSTWVDAGTLTPTGPGVTATITRPGQNAQLTFAGTAHIPVSLGFTASSIGEPAYVDVIAPDGTVVDDDHYVNGADEIDLPDPPRTGTYTIVVRPTRAATGSVTLTLSRRVSGGALTPGGPAGTATISRPGQDAVFTFDGTAGQRPSLGFTGAAAFGGGGVYVGVYEPDGSELDTRWVSQDQIVDVADLPVAGTYTVVVDPYRAGTGQIGVALTIRAQAPAARSSVLAPAARPAAPAPAAASVAGEKPAASDADWTPDTANLQGVDWNIRGARPPRVTPPLAPAGVTALAGLVRTVDGKALPGVTLTAGRVTTTTDGKGRFLLAGLPSGTSTLDVDGGTASTKGHRYGFYSVKVDLAAGRTTVLPYTIWMQQLDTRHMVRFDSPTRAEVVLTTPKIPGLEVRIPAGSVIRDKSGKVITELGITPIPIDRPPFPLPPNGIVPVYFTVQPGGTFVFPDGARVVYPNYTKLPPGHTVDFWNYDPERQGWHVYGHGKVSADGKQVVPDPGTKVWSFYGGMFNTELLPKWLLKWLKDLWKWVNGDPVELSTGQLMDARTDLAVDDVMPIEITRTLYQGDTAPRDFGVGQIGGYNAFLHSEEQYQEVDLYLPGGAVVHYVRTSPGTGFNDAIFTATGTPGEYRGSTISRDNDRAGWELRRRDGMRYFFPQYAPLTEIKDPNGNTITLTRDGEHKLTKVTSPNGRWIALTYNADKRVTGLRDNIGRTVSYTYDAGGHLETVTDAGGKTMRYTYDAAGRMRTATDTRGIVYLTNEYDAAGRVSVQTLTNGQVYRFAYVTDAGGRITETRVTRPGGAVQRVTFNAEGAATSRTEAYGTPEAQSVTFTRGAGQRLDSLTDSRGRVTALSYDAQGRVTHETRLAGTPDAVDGPKITYGPLDRPATITDELGKVTRYQYDARGNLLKETDPLGREFTATYNAAGQILTLTDPAGETTTNAYRLGDLRSTTDPLGRVTRFFTDAAGRVVQTTDPAGSTATIAYDARNQVTSATDPLGRVFTFAYDANGNRTKLTDPRKNSISWEYDDSDRITKVIDPLGASTTTTYTPAGEVATATGRRGKVTRLTYDPLGRTRTVEYGVNGATAESRVDLTYENGNLKSVADTAAAGATTFTYDPLDRVTRVGQPTGRVDYTYDRANRPSGLTVQGRPPVTYSYDDAGAIARIERGALAVVPHYDDAGRQDRLDLPGGWSQAYDYDDTGRVTAITYRHGATGKGNLAYTYDPVGQITAVDGSFARVALPAASGAMVYDKANRMISRGGQALEYDPDGNLTGDGTTIYGWDARGRLSGLSRKGLTAQFRYDAEGRRDRVSVSGDVRGYVTPGENPLAETDGAGNVTADLMTAGVDQWFGRVTASGAQAYLTDLHGSTLGLGAADGTLKAEYAYDPYGGATVTGDPGGNRFTYTGREDDGTGLMYYRARYYSPTLGRFISEDPIGVQGGTNLYGYASGDPVNLTDPSGNNPMLVACVGGAIGGGGLEYVSQRLSGRKVSWSSVAREAALGCGFGMLGKAFELGKLAGCVGNSFTGDTPVLMADGTRKPIRDVRVGDRVAATDPRTGVTRSEPVTAVIEGTGAKDLVRITVDVDGGRGTATGTVTATDGHPFWVPARGWVDAGELVPGTWLRTSAGTYVQVTAIRKVLKWERVHNLTVGDTHTYYVSTGGRDLLVHNATCPAPSWPAHADFSDMKQLSKKFDAHALDFGISGNRNKSTLSDFVAAMREHMAAPGTTIHQFTYKGQGTAIAFIDTSSGKMVMFHPDGTFWSAWNLSPAQLVKVANGYLD
ncbi:RHS repeat-associated core domain-containing protein [Sphaerisporangium sp. NPDC051017]|uniref:RHS repeat-associated core domain-containing protein n=1 Tax=Sphaerisporangium sp. NPDC051017 TaxID=3154636 RepID=UPI003439510B